MFKATGNFSGIAYDILVDDAIIDEVDSNDFLPNNVQLTDGGLGSINFPQQRKSKVNFKFMKAGTQEPATVPGAAFTVYDIDSSKFGPEEVTVYGAKSYAPGFGHEDYYVVGQPTPGAVTFSSTKKGWAADNPVHPRSLTTEQLAKSVTFAFADMSSFQLEVDLTRMDVKGGRNLLFSFVHELVTTENCLAVVPDCGPGECSIADDPHVRVFDGRQISLLQDRKANVESMEDFFLKNGLDVWVVNSGAVDIQARYSRDETLPEDNLFVHSLAIGGKLMQGNRLIVGPLNGTVTYNGEEILTEQESTFSPEGLFVARRHLDSKLVQNMEVSNPGLDIELPQNIKLTINRQPHYVNLFISMSPAVGGQDGLCGNFNGDADDDSLEFIEKRDIAVTAAQSMFRDSESVNQGESLMFPDSESVNQGESLFR